MVDERKQNSISYSSQVVFCGFQVALLVEPESTGLKSVAASLAAPSMLRSELDRPVLEHNFSNCRC